MVSCRVISSCSSQVKSPAQERDLKKERLTERDVCPYPRPGDVDDSGAWQDKGRGRVLGRSSGRLGCGLVVVGQSGGG